MAIRLRKMPNGGYAALCAAKSKPKDGDVYLDDSMHHALSIKFSLDFKSEGLIDPLVDLEDRFVVDFMKQEQTEKGDE